MNRRTIVVLAIGLSAELLGCARTTNGSKFAFPWQNDTKEKIPGIKTPQERIDELKELAAKGPNKPEVSAELARQIQHEQDPQVRLYIVRAMATMTDQTASAVIHAGLEDPSNEVRIACCEAWGKRGGPEAVRELSTVLEAESNIDVRLAAARALGVTKQTTAVPVLAKMLADNDPAMQRRVIESLKGVSGKDYGYDVEAWRQYAAGEKVKTRSLSLAERWRNLF
jgi:hypothetical protein